MPTGKNAANTYSLFAAPGLILLLASQLLSIAALTSNDAESLSALIARISVVLAAIIAVLAANFALLNYVRAISAPNDDKHHRPTAALLSLLIFCALIGAYASAYLVEMPQELEAKTSGPDFGETLHSVIASLYFSTVTISTLGYGDIEPQGEFARITAAIEALNGLLAFGIFTGTVTGFFAAKTLEAESASLSQKRLEGDGDEAEADG